MEMEIAISEGNLLEMESATTEPNLLESATPEPNLPESATTKLNLHENATPEPNIQAQAKTLSSMCRWWVTTKQETLPGICHWFVDPNKDDNTDIEYPGSFFDTNMGMSATGHSHSTNNFSLVHMLILGGVFLIFIITAIITCIKRKMETQAFSEEVTRNARISNHIRRTNSVNILSVLEESKDLPPDYATAVKTKETEEEMELPSYSQAVPVTDKDYMKNIDNSE